MSRTAIWHLQPEAEDSFRTPYPTHIAQTQVLAACGMEFKPVRVRILTPEEGKYVRSHFTQKTKNNLWQFLLHEKQREIRKLYPRITSENCERLFRQQVAAFNNMDLHHTCQIMTCPIGRSPYDSWDKTLDWWRNNAHYDLAATNRTLHKLIHRVQDYKIAEAFGEEALSGTRRSGEFIGRLEIAVLPGEVWDFPRPGLEASAERLMKRESERKADLREQVNQARSTGENVIYMSPDRTLEARPAWPAAQWHPLNSRQYQPQF